MMSIKVGVLGEVSNFLGSLEFVSFASRVSFSRVSDCKYISKRLGTDGLPDKFLIGTGVVEDNTGVVDFLDSGKVTMNIEVVVVLVGDLVVDDVGVVDVMAGELGVVG